MESKLKPITLEQFIELFPLVELPVVLTEESILSFSSLNKTLPMAAILDYILEEEEEMDEFTEFVPCLSFAVSEDILAIVYWKGTLLSYDYFVMCIDLKRSKLISKKIIAGTKVLDNIIIKSNAVISPELEIEVLVNSYASSDQFYPVQSISYHIEIMKYSQT